MTIDYNKKPRYEFNSQFMRMAWELYCQGISSHQMADRMQKEWPGICRQTICKIINKYQWEEQRVRYITLKIDDADERRKILADAKANYDKLKALINGPDPNHQHFAQWLAMVQLIREIEGWDKHGASEIALSNDQEMNAWLESVAEDEIVGAALKKRKAEIKKRFEEKLKEKGIDKTQGAGKHGDP